MTEIARFLAYFLLPVSTLLEILLKRALSRRLRRVDRLAFQPFLRFYGGRCVPLSAITEYLFQPFLRFYRSGRRRPKWS